MSMNGTARALPKSPVLVEVALTDGSVFHGNIFVHRQARLTDVLNDDRQFLPVQTTDGKYLAIAKSFIRQVTLTSSESTAYKGTDPYKILGVQEGVSLEDLKRAYHQLCLANHPDRIRGFGLSPEYQELGTKNTARINEAYAKVLKSLGH
jgi:DnaJ-domain-containing protein 1